MGVMGVRGIQRPEGDGVGQRTGGSGRVREKRGRRLQDGEEGGEWKVGGEERGDRVTGALGRGFGEWGDGDRPAQPTPGLRRLPKGATASPSVRA